ncbi:MAG: NAD(P)H-dependent oxidoreductase [Lachnospiraceae bacterium]|nr:NAD(P)H-dependent oxidoreductase [Lachnospiraceae bacterium]
MKLKNEKGKRKKNLIVLMVLLVILGLGFAGYNLYRFPATLRNLSDHSLNEEKVDELKQELNAKADKKVLVTYFSYSGTTKKVAQALSERTGADLFEIKTKKEYSNVYTESNSEIRRNEKPELADAVEQPEAYDIVFVGYPVWWHATPAPVNTFLESYDWKGKLIIPFCTSGESDIDETMPTFLNSCGGLAVHEGKRIQGAGEVDAWLEELDLGFTGDEKTSDMGEDAEEISDKEPNAEDGKVLVVYFSWSASGNTEKMAKVIQEQTKGDLFEIEPAKPYPDDYEECAEVAKAEKENNERPELASLPDSIEKYDRIYIGYPIWWHTAPMVIGTFLENYDLSGIDVYPFTQSASMDEDQFEESMEFVRKSAGKANVHDGLFTEATNTEAILSYLDKNN